MVKSPDPALLRAIKFFNDKRQGPADNVPIDKMPMYYDSQTDRMFVNVFLGSHIQSAKPFKFNEQAMFDWMPRFAGKPIVLFKYGEHFEHPVIAGASKEINERFQETKKVGEVLLPFDRPNEKGTWRGIGEILIDKIKSFLKSLHTDEVPMFTSPQVAYTDPDYDIKDADPMHLALTDDPAFPPEISMVTGVCEGDQSTCMAKLAQATANNFEAGDTCYKCFRDSMEDLVFNNAVKQTDDSSLKILSFSSKLSMEANNDSSGQQSLAENKNDSESKTPAQITDELITKKANDAVSKMMADIESRKQNPQTADPQGTMNKAFGNEQKPEGENKKEFNIKETTEYKELLSKVQNMEAKERKESIAKIIPLALVTDPKTNGINEKRLNEFVDFWINTDKSPEEIADLYAKQMQQIELVTQPKQAKASNSDSFSNDELASKMTDSEPQFDAPDVNNSDNNEKFANASANDGFDPLDFASMLVSDVSTNNEVSGAARKMIL